MTADRFGLRWLIVSIIVMTFGLPTGGNAQDKSNNAGQSVQLGIITLYHPLVMYRNYQPFADYLTKSTGRSIEIKITENYAQIIDYLRTGKVQAAILGGMTYLEATQQVDILPLLGALGKNRKPLCRGAFITRSANSDIRRITDLPGKTFAFASIHSTSGNLMPLYHLYTQTDVRLTDFAVHKNLKYHDSVVREVLRGNFDAGVALGTIADQYTDVGLRIIAETEPFPGFVLAVRRDLPADIRESICSSLLALDYDNMQHRAIMDKWDVNIRYGFTEVDDRDYDNIRKAIRFLFSMGIELR